MKFMENRMSISAYNLNLNSCFQIGGYGVAWCHSVYMICVFIARQFSRKVYIFMFAANCAKIWADSINLALKTSASSARCDHLRDAQKSEQDQDCRIDLGINYY